MIDKIRLTPEDNGTLDEDLPYVFPLLPKMLHVKPQIGELVLVIFTFVTNTSFSKLSFLASFLASFFIIPFLSAKY